ncbi:FAD-binding protein [Aureimonas sp. Leaf454]|uniref:FAD-binding protein n=1 Tax=Aureimonas sp. Leaf454 TaxID=1736381 RepID=UPI000AF0D0DC|nr:FAD-binding protein [Aureimonas sp. Leaf454]
MEWGYPFPNDDGGNLYVANLRGPDYMRFMRARVAAAGIRILDHHPILELIGDGHAVKGAQGMARRTGASFRVEAGAVVLATGGCAFFERILGGTGLTGDGHLFAAEAGASLSGMEFTGKYTLAPKGSSLNKGLPFRWATFYRPDGTPLKGHDGEILTNGIGPAERVIARALTEGEVLARLDLADAGIRDALRRGQPNCFAPYDKMGIDPFSAMFPVELKFEGTIRGTGGIRIASSECATEVPGLFVAGDAASRENVTGGISGGGAINSSWAMASGWWAGRGASAQARRRRGRPEAASAPLGRTGLRARHEASPVDLDRAVRTVRAEIAPLERNYHRTAATLASGRQAVEDVWRELEKHLEATGRDRLRAREVAAVTAATRWTLAAAELRTESRGVHRRSDHPAENDALRRRIAVSDLRSVQADWEDDADTLGLLEGSAS